MRESSDNSREKKRKTILVVDDEKRLREFLGIRFRKEGYDVVSAEDGQAGWTEYTKAKPDLVVLDLKMPRSDGSALLKRIRQQDSLTPVVIITGYATHESMVEAARLGANDYFVKPFVPKVMDLVVERWLSGDSMFLSGNLLTSALAKDNQRLSKRIEELSEGLRDRRTNGDLDKYMPILGAAVHSLKGEFMHISNSIVNLRELTSGAPDVTEEYDMIERSIQYSQVLLRRLLDYLDMGRPSTAPVDTLEVLQKVESLARPRLPSSLKFVLRADRREKRWLANANIEQLMGVVLELIQNAVQVLREKGGTIELKLEENKGEIAISVTDSGPGIPKELRKKLFKKQVKSESGLGLGLFLCNKVITQLGGKLSLQTSSEEGTTFTVLLPLAKRSQES